MEPSRIKAYLIKALTLGTKPISPWRGTELERLNHIYAGRGTELGKIEPWAVRRELKHRSPTSQLKPLFFRQRVTSTTL